MTLEEAIEEYENIAKYHADPHSNGDWHYTNKIIAENSSQLVEWLKELKQLREQSQWISVSERLPEENKKVIVSDVFGVYIGEFIDAEESWGGEHFVNEHGMHSKSVIAWMPLPEPCKAES